MRTERAATAVTDRPLRVIDLVDGAFAALRYRPRVVFLSVLWIVVPFAILEGWNSQGLLGGGGLIGALNDPTVFAEANQGTSFTTTSATYLIDWARISLVGISIAYLIDSWADGRDPSVTEVMKFTARRLPVWVLTFIAAKLAIGIGLILIIPGVAFALAFALASPLLAIERRGPIATLRRAFALMRRRTGQVMGIYVACAVISGFLSTALAAVPQGIALAVGTDVAWPLITVGSIVATALGAPFNGAAMTLMYHDIRFRTEGLDLRRRADVVFPDASGFSNGHGSVMSDG